MKKMIDFLAVAGTWTRGGLGRRVWVCLALALLALAPQSASAYYNLGNDRVLLMNNDAGLSGGGVTKPAVKGQGYYDTNTTAGVTYWTHAPEFYDDTNSGSTAKRRLMYGTEHILYSATGQPLWRLTDCRVGWSLVTSTERNQIPCSSTALESAPPAEKVTYNGKKYTFVENSTNATIMLRNLLSARVYSPYYEEGIGTIYLDTVNSYVDQTNGTFQIQIATNVTDQAIDEDVKFNEIEEKVEFSHWDEYYDWQTIPVTMLEIRGTNGKTGSASIDYDTIQEGVTNINPQVVDSAGSASNHFYRVRAQLNCRKPIRFRIKRVVVDEDPTSAGLDASGFILIDNILASYPPMTVTIDRYGDEMDDTLTGANVLGNTGDFTSPFLSIGQTNAYAHVRFNWVTNSGDEPDGIKVSNPMMYYRWRYLTQKINDWQSFKLSTKSVKYSSGAGDTQFLATASIPLTDGVGDLEYYFQFNVSAPYYNAVDYAFDRKQSLFGRISGTTTVWSEAITSVSNRLEMADADDRTPACGTDYFTRIREGASDYEWVKLCTTVWTNGAEVAVTNNIRMELIGDHTWRYNYYMAQDAVGDTLKFHFQGKLLYTNGVDLAFHAKTNTWYCDLATLPYTPYTSSAGLSFTHDIAMTLDSAATHLVIEFNDELLTFSVSHGTYQNFNAWTDAIDGYVGNLKWNGEGTNGQSAAGVSDVKTKYESDMSDWKLADHSNAHWKEDFESTATELYPFDVTFDGDTTPNGWSAEHGQFIRGTRGGSDRALQMEGRGQGWVGVDSFTEDVMPKGIDTVSFRARIAQAPRFDDFAYYLDGSAFTNYAISAKVKMSSSYDSKNPNNPIDISPGKPSVSLVGYYRPATGCYEFRMTRVGEYQLGLELYKWLPSANGMKSTLLVSNVVATAKTYAKAGDLQPTIEDMTHVLVPPKNENLVVGGVTAYLFIYRKNANDVYLECALGKNYNISKPADDTSLTKVLYYDDTKNPLKKGTFGVGSTDCNASFFRIAKHESKGTNPTKDTANLDLGGVPQVTTLANEDWVFFSDRWRHKTEVSSINDKWLTANLVSVIPTNQTVKLEFKSTSDSGSGWFESGYEQTINSFSTNRFSFTPQVSSSYSVRLRTGGHTYDEVRTDVVVDDIQFTDWRAENYPGLGNFYAQYEHWVYMMGTVQVAGSGRVCVLQPSRGLTSKDEKTGKITVTQAMGLRSPYLEKGLSMFVCNYKDADSHAKLWLQICTNDYISSRSSMSESLSIAPPDDERWHTVTNWDFSKMTVTERASGTLTYFMSLREPYQGIMRIVVDPELLIYCREREGKSEIVDYGKITITSLYCYDEPALDLRSWYGWNVHTEGWNTDDKRFAYLTDSPEGLSGSLNFSAVNTDNTSTDAQGIGLKDQKNVSDYAFNNPYIQTPPITNGIGSVSFRARVFDPNKVTNATAKVQSSWITLYGTKSPDDEQGNDGGSWVRIKDFEVTNTTYQTFSWSTTDEDYHFWSLRLEAAGARHGRQGSGAKPWETPQATPIQRVFIDEIVASEPIAPRVIFRNVRPFRSELMEMPAPVITNIADLSEQPLLGESWGLQATVEPQQMDDQIEDSTIKVYAAFFRGIYPWGYVNWSNNTNRIVTELDRVSGTYTFRSTLDHSDSIIGPDQTPSNIYPENVWQYFVWCEFLDKAGVKHRHSLEASDWTVPYWYYGIDNLNTTMGSQGFAGYTMLDTISPKRAWINEISLAENCEYDNSDGKQQFIELAIPRGADITGWRLNVLGSGNALKKGSIVTFGYNNAQISPNPKIGTRPGVDWTNNYTVVALRSPEAKTAGNIPEADGAWDTLTSEVNSSLQMTRSSFQYYESYGIELVRPSGVIEQQIIIQGTNVYQGTVFEEYGEGTNLLAKVRKQDGEDSFWFFAGSDQGKGTLGVYTNHGESASCWTNFVVHPTPGELNMLDDGTRQFVDPHWYLQPNGTNVWIYATVYGDHLHQKIGKKTSNSEVLVIRKGSTTNIVYTTDKWWAVGEVTTNDVLVAEAAGHGDRAEGHTWSLTLPNVEKTLTVSARAQQGAEVTRLGLDPNDPYHDAIMAWLATKDETASLYLAKFIPLSGNVSMASDLNLRDMYWLNIDPTEKDWALVGGMGTKATADDQRMLPAAKPEYKVEDGRIYTNRQVIVTMMITNLTTGVAYAPNTLQGIEPGSSSADYQYGTSPAWTSVTFKISGALQRADDPDVAKSYYPLRWFVFGPDSFDENFQAKIDLWDPFSPNSPGWFYGWDDYPDTQIFFKWQLNAEPATFDTAEMLKADSTYGTGK